MKKSKEIPAEIMDYILNELQQLNSGEIVLIAQDGFLIQLDHLKKIRIADLNSSKEVEKFSEQQKKSLSERIRKEFSTLDFGRLAIKLTTKNRIQLERTEMQRFTGIDGDGI